MTTPQFTPAPREAPGHTAMAEPAVILDQGHARLHYAVALALQDAGILEAAFCDFYNTEAGFSRLAVGALRRLHPATGQRMADRRNDRLDPARVETDRGRTLLLDAMRVFLKVPAHRHWSRWSRVRSTRIRRRGLHRGNTLHGFVTSLHPPLVREARERGLLTSGEQIIAPVAEQVREARIQQERFPGAAEEAWEIGRDWLGEVEAATWPLLGCVTCPSAYVKNALVAAGLEEQRIHVHPYPYQVRAEPAPERPRDARPLTVGFLGGVNLRKGAPYFLQVARRLASDRLRFRMVGPIGLSDAMVRSHAGCVDFAGGVSRSRVREEMRNFDVFYFPSTCEGSAGVVYEAADARLPVVTSPNSGTHLIDGAEARLCAYDDVDGACARIEELAGDAGLRAHLGDAAHAALGRCTVGGYGRFLRGVFEDALASARG